MIESYLLNYGILGVWTATLLVERYKYNKDMKTVIKTNSDVMTKVQMTIQKCQK